VDADALIDLGLEIDFQDPDDESSDDDDEDDEDDNDD